MTWIVDGRRDDTPPGGALIIELWKNRKSEDYSVRLYYTAQTLEQMRSTATLSPTNPPQRAPIFLPGCSKEDFSCTWPEFSNAIRQAIDPRYVSLRSKSRFSHFDHLTQLSLIKVSLQDKPLAKF